MERAVSIVHRLGSVGPCGRGYLFGRRSGAWVTGGAIFLGEGQTENFKKELKSGFGYKITIDSSKAGII